MGTRLRVLIVDPSRVLCRMLEKAFLADAWLEVVGTAQDEHEATRQASRLRPDVIILDIGIAEHGGVEAVRQIRRLTPDSRVILVRTTTGLESVSSEWFASGADEYVTEIAGGQPLEELTAKLRLQLSAKMRQFFEFTGESTSRTSQSSRRTAESSSRASYVAPKVIAIGVSTGGPAALAQIIPQFPPDFRLPILVVQHMPPRFTSSLCERLQQRSQIPVHEATQGELLRGGFVYLAPGDFHMRVKPVGVDLFPRIGLDQSPPENSCRPAVDVLFDSVAQVFGGASIAVVLTGMGQDGLRGARKLKSCGATIFAQDEKSSAVWGMPRAIAEAGIADAILPLDEIIPNVMLSCLPRGRPQLFPQQEAR